MLTGIGCLKTDNIRLCVKFQKNQLNNLVEILIILKLKNNHYSRKLRENKWKFIWQQCFKIYDIKDQC